MLAHKPAADFDSDFFVHATNFFKFCGIWRTDKGPWWLEPYVYFSRFNVYITFGWAFVALVVSGSYIYFREGDIDHALSWGTFTLAYFTMQYKFTLLCRNELKIRALIKRLEVWSSQYPDKTNVGRMLEICNKLLLLGTLLIGIACVAFCCYPLFMKNSRVLPLKPMITFGLNVLKSPTYEIYILYVTAGTLSHTILSIAYDMTYIGILLTTSSILRNLNSQMRMDLLQSNFSSAEKYRSLVKHIMEHSEILGYLNEIRDLYMTSNLLHFFYNYTNAGLTMFQLSKLPIVSLQFLAIILGFSAELFGLMTYCESGQKITDEMNEFWLLLYSTGWYEESIKFSRTISFALLGTQKEYYMAAGKLMTLSRETEKKIMNAIFTYYAFLHRLN